MNNVACLSCLSCILLLRCFMPSKHCLYVGFVNYRMNHSSNEAPIFFSTLYTRCPNWLPAVQSVFSIVYVIIRTLVTRINTDLVYIAYLNLLISHLYISWLDLALLMCCSLFKSWQPLDSSIPLKWNRLKVFPWSPSENVQLAFWDRSSWQKTLRPARSWQICFITSQSWANLKGCSHIWQVNPLKSFLDWRGFELWKEVLASHFGLELLLFSCQDCSSVLSPKWQMQLVAPLTGEKGFYSGSSAALRRWVLSMTHWVSSKPWCWCSD